MNPIDYSHLPIRERVRLAMPHASESEIDAEVARIEQKGRDLDRAYQRMLRGGR